MSWLFNRASARGKEYDPATMRARHVASLLQYVPQARPFNAEQTMFDVELPFATGTSRRCILRIFLPPQFPTTAPSMQIIPPARGIVFQHPWLNKHFQVIGHSQLLQWDSHYDLGQIALQVVQQLTSSPPTIINTNAPGPKQQQQQAPQSEPLQRKLSADMSHTPMPAIPASFPELADLSSEELKVLLQDQDAFDVLINGMENVKNMRELLLDLQKSNLEAATATLPLEADIKAARDEVVALHETLKEARAEFDEKQQRQAAALNQRSPEAFVTELESAAAEADEASESLAYELSRETGDENIRPIVKKLVAERTKFHMLKIMADRILAGQHRGGGVGGGGSM